jgi:hypothetical protein
MPGMMRMASYGANLDQWVNLDGRLNAPTVSGGPQLPAILNKYHPNGQADARYLLGAGGGYQPLWHVAGVDYPVGYPSATSFTAWTAVSGTGITVDSTHGRVTYDSLVSPTVDSIDFTSGVSATLLFTNCTGTITVQNCKFIIANPPPSDFTVGVITAGNTNTANLVVKFNTIDGGFPPNSASASAGNALISYSAGQAFTAQYNLLQNSPSHCFEINSGNASLSVDIRFNLIQMIGNSGTTGNHPNTLQPQSSGPGVLWRYQFNLVYQSPGTTAAGELLQFEGDDANTFSLANVDCGYCTLLSTGSAGTSSSNMIHGNRNSSSPSASNCTVHDCFIDPSGSDSTSNPSGRAPFYPSVWSGWTRSDCTDMRNGNNISTDA